MSVFFLLLCPFDSFSPLTLRSNIAEELKLQGNRLTGSIPDEICFERGTGNGEIGVLTVGCDIYCTCCDPLPEC